MKQSNWIDYFLLVLVMFFWGLSWPVSKMLINYATSLQIGFFRFLFAGIVFFAILIVKYRRNFKTYTFRTFGKFFLLGLLGIFGYGILFLTAMHYTTSAQGAVIAGIQPSIIAGLAFLIHKEKIYPRWRYFGLAFSFLGVLVIIGIQPFLDFNLDHLIGNLIIVVAFLLFALYSIYGKSVMKEYNSFETTTWATISGMGLFGLGALFENKWDQLQIDTSTFWISILLLSLGTTVIGFFFYFYAINRIGATKSGIFINLVPVFGTLLSVIILDEKLSWTLWVGMLLISLGIFFVNFPLKIKDKVVQN